ncbi:hypothetical protein J6Z37_02380 [Candidatus Saccharibacteria bacterium]|nr:hypothetical protein [Candidatus Saccharibacteria bacterium]
MSTTVFGLAEIRHRSYNNIKDSIMKKDSKAPAVIQMEYPYPLNRIWGIDKPRKDLDMKKLRKLADEIGDSVRDYFDEAHS